MARVDVEVAVVRIGGRVESGEVEPLDRLGDEPVQLRRTDPAGDGRDLGVDEPGGLDRQGRGGVDGGLGDRACPPRGNPAGVDLRPQPWEAVAELEGVAHELLRRGRRDAQDGAELGEAELRDQRRTLTRDRLLVLTTRHGERSHVVDRLRRVQVGPPGRDDQEVAAARSSAAFRSRASASRSEAVRSSTSPLRGPASVSIMCSILSATTDSDHGCGRLLATLSRSGFVVRTCPSTSAGALQTVEAPGFPRRGPLSLSRAGGWVS